MDSPCEPAWTYFSVRAAEVAPQVGVVPVRTAVIGQAVQFVAVPCGGSLHASALLALVVAMRVIKHFLQCNEFQTLEEAPTRRESHDGRCRWE